MSKITGFGTYVPERIVDNKHFEEIIDTNDEWIVSRTGIKTRRYSKEGEYTSDMAVKAIRDLQKNSGKEISDVDYIVVCTTSPDQTMPNVASRIQYKLDLPNAGCNDLYAACAGFVYGLQIAHGLVNAGVYKKVLVVGSETLTKVTDFNDRTSCILFGDGAGVAMVEGPLLLARILRDFEGSAVSGRDPVPVAHLTVRAKDGIWLRLRRR